MKQIVLMATLVLLMGSCKKDMISDTSGQADLTLKKYADISTHALLISSNKKTGVQVSASQHNNGNSATRPILSSGSGTISYNPGACGDGTLQVSSVGTGISTALGSLTQVTTFCITSAGQPMSSIDGIGTASNGDKLFYTLTGMGTDQAGLVYQEYAFTGGTGRFASAKGNLTLLYQVYTPVSYSYTGKGMITY